MKKENKVVLTPEGFLELEAELNDLKLNKRPEVISTLKYARSLGDLSENADYDAARNEQAQLESRIKELEYKLEHCEIVDNKDKNIANVGSTIVIEYEPDDCEEFKIVGSLEADAFNNKISNESPIGKAVIGHKAGEKISVESPNGSYEVILKSVS
ncbi:MAG: transcription elongation factor GreA [Bacilli bacterium]|nr:transcription elongation factor GreA [Bacilli bacterium]